MKTLTCGAAALAAFILAASPALAADAKPPAKQSKGKDAGGFQVKA